MKAYKLTDQNGQTKNFMQWGENVSHTAVGNSKELCSDGWIHFYTDPLLAVLMNPVHACFDFPLLWECETSGAHLHEALKSGCKTLTTLRQIPLPEITQTQKVAFGILCAKEVCVNEEWNRWADKWLSGEDRTQESAYVARSAVDAAAATAAAAADAAADAARSAAAAAAYYAAYAACAANNKSIDFVKLAHEAMTYR